MAENRKRTKERLHVKDIFIEQLYFMNRGSAHQYLTIPLHELHSVYL